MAVLKQIDLDVAFKNIYNINLFSRSRNIANFKKWKLYYVYVYSKNVFFNHKLEKKSSLIFLSFARFYSNFLDKTKMVLRKILIVATI